jgi:hypothetical protein
MSSVIRRRAGDKLLIAASHDELPPADWFVGKRPMDVERYRRNSAGPEP